MTRPREINGLVVLVTICAVVTLAGIAALIITLWE